MSHDRPDASADRRALVIGLDGATWDRLEPWMAQGRLPHLRRLVEEGVRGRLRTVIPPVTAAAWTSFMTGLNPGKHGVFEFILRLRPDFREVPVNSTLRDGVPLWTLLSEAGKTVVVVNVPVTYPPEKVRGVQVSCFLTPRGRRDFIHPPELLAEIEKELGPYELYHREVYRPGAAGAVLEELERVFDYNLRVARLLATRNPWDFLMLHFWGLDRAQHEVWHLVDPNHPAYDKREAEKYGPRLLDYYARVDEGIGELRDLAREKGALFLVMSDHGFGPITRFFMPNLWLLERGYLEIRRDARTRLKRAAFEAGFTPALAYRVAMRLGLAKLRLSGGFHSRKGLVDLVQRLFLSLSDADWTRTRAFSRGNYGQIYVNLRGREPHGIVEPGAEYEAVCEDIVRALRETEDPDTGRPFFGEVHRREEIYEGPYVDLAPDIVYLPADMSAKALGTLDFSSNRFLEPVYGNSGDHRMEGIVAAAGKGVRRGGVLEGATILDLAPTLLHSMGCPVPRAMDGRVLTAMFEPDGAAARPVEFSDRPLVRGVRGQALPEDENEAIRRQLRGVGYVG